MQRREVLFGGAALVLGTSRAAALAPVMGPGQVTAIARRVAEEWAARPEIMRYDVPPVHAPHYAEVATALGAARLPVPLGEDPLALVKTRWEQARSIPNTANHVDANVVGMWPMLTGDRAGVALADGQWTEVDADGLTTQARFWIDDIWMIGALQVQAWNLTGDKKFLDRAALMARIYVERLQQPNGLFHHGPEAPFFWGRGNGWVAAGLAEVLSVLPPEHPERPAILAAYVRMMEALLAHQARDGGYWRQLIDYPEAWGESSCTAMFGFAMLRGVNRGLLPADPFRRAADRAWNSTLASTDRDRRLQFVCAGTGQSKDAQYYLDRPRVTGDLHGQAPLLWLIAELLVAMRA